MLYDMFERFAPGLTDASNKQTNITFLVFEQFALTFNMLYNVLIDFRML